MKVIRIPSQPVQRQKEPVVIYFIVTAGYEPAAAPAPTAPAWQGRSIGTSKLRLVEFSAFLEQQRDPDSVSIKNTPTRASNGERSHFSSSFFLDK